MSQVKNVFNPFQIGEIAVEQSLRALQTSVKIAETNEKFVQQMIDFQRKNREEALKSVDVLAEQVKQNLRLFAEMGDKVLAFQVQSYKAASKAGVDEINKQFAQFSKS